jgi:hypothetical protein
VEAEMASHVVESFLPKAGFDDSVVEIADHSDKFESFIWQEPLPQQSPSREIQHSVTGMTSLDAVPVQPGWSAILISERRLRPISDSCRRFGLRKLDPYPSFGAQPNAAISG